VLSIVALMVPAGGIAYLGVASYRDERGAVTAQNERQRQAALAVVTRIDPQASFTPENTYFRSDRVKQVVGVKLGLRGAVGFAKPGMPADGEILVEGSVWPPARRR